MSMSLLAFFDYSQQLPLTLLTHGGPLLLALAFFLRDWVRTRNRRP